MKRRKTPERTEESPEKALEPKKLAKGMNIADIAEALEETEERIREIVAEVTGEQKE